MAAWLGGGVAAFGCQKHACLHVLTVSRHSPSAATAHCDMCHQVGRPTQGGGGAQLGTSSEHPRAAGSVAGFQDGVQGVRRSCHVLSRVLVIQGCCTDCSNASFCIATSLTPETLCRLTDLLSLDNPTLTPFQSRKLEQSKVDRFSTLNYPGRH